VQVLVEKVKSFGGQVEELSPGGVMAAFGLEPAEDAPRRAAHAAMAIHKAGERARRAGDDPWEFRIGIHVDQLLVGQAAGHVRIDPDAKRDAGGILDVLVGAADGGTTVVSEAAASPLERRLALVDILRHAFRITEADGPERVRERVHAGLRELEIEPDEAAPFLLRLFGVREGAERLEMLSDEVMRARTLDAFRQLILKGGRRRPIIFVVEDLHWVDKASEDCLTFLVEHLAASPILFLAIYRPGYRPPWMDKSYATQIALQPLSHQESLELV